MTWILLKDGSVREKVLGPSPSKGHQVQLVIEAGTWFGGFLNPGGEYALMGTTVAPAFDFADFELGTGEKLSAEFPQAKDWILKLT